MPKQVISFHYTLKDKDGNLIETSKDKHPLEFLEGSRNIIPDLEVEILTLAIGESKEVKISHEKAYGVYNQSLIYRVPKEKFPAKEAKVGDVFQMGNKDQQQLVTLVEITEKEIVLDANHPLAGVDLTFMVELISKRDATVDEISHGHVHGPHGHHH